MLDLWEFYKVIKQLDLKYLNLKIRLSQSTEAPASTNAEERFQRLLHHLPRKAAPGGSD